jgi:hypothetical protein
MKTVVLFCALCIAAGGMALWVFSPHSQTYAAVSSMPTIESLNIAARYLPDETFKEPF